MRFDLCLYASLPEPWESLSNTGVRAVRVSGEPDITEGWLCLGILLSASLVLPHSALPFYR